MSKLKKMSAACAVALLLIAGLAITAWKKVLLSSAQTPGQFGQLEVIQQIPEVAITNAEIAPTGAHGRIRFSIRNDSQKAVDGVAVSIDGEYLGISGKVTTGHAWTIVNRNIHPDIDAHHQQNHPIWPGQEEQIKDEEILLDDTLVSVQKLTVRIAYVRFVDGTSAGTDDKAGHLISDVTIGAEKYKKWLVAKYVAAGRSKQTLEGLLNANGLPPELDVPKGGAERTGAFIYKNHFRRALAEKTFDVDDFLK